MASFVLMQALDFTTLLLLSKLTLISFACACVHVHLCMCACVFVHLSSVSLCLSLSLSVSLCISLSPSLSLSPTQTRAPWWRYNKGHARREVLGRRHKETATAHHDGTVSTCTCCASHGNRTDRVFCSQQQQQQEQEQTLLVC